MYLKCSFILLIFIDFINLLCIDTSSCGSADLLCVEGWLKYPIIMPNPTLTIIAAVPNTIIHVFDNILLANVLILHFYDFLYRKQ